MKTPTIILAIVLFILVAAFISQNLKREYKKAVADLLEQTGQLNGREVTEEDLQNLPTVVQKYLRKVGVVGHPLPVNFRVTGSGGIRSFSDQPYMKFKSEQHNSIENPVRAFYIKARKMGIPAFGLHLFREGKAFMVIKLAGLIKVVDARGPEMDQGETVTFFNDICMMAPALLIDKSIVWEVRDSLSVKATYTRSKISISADLFFNEEGDLVNFISYDRFETTDGKEYLNYPWETPVSEYREFNGFRLPCKARLIYKHPGEDFCYGEFEILEVEYNVK